MDGGWEGQGREGEMEMAAAGVCPSLSLVSMIMADFGDERIDMQSQGDQVS